MSSGAFLAGAALFLAAASLDAAPVTRDVTTLGAKPDDDADDAAAIQKTIDGSAAGDTVYLPAGTFLLDHGLRAKSGVKVRGSGQGKTVVKIHAGARMDFFDLSGAEGVEISGFTIDGDRSPHAHHGIYGHTGGHHTIHHLTIQDLGSPDGPLAVHFTGDGGGGGRGVTDCVIADNVIRNVGLGSPWGGGIRLSWGCSRNQVLRNVIDGTGRGGIFANDGSSDLVIRGNTVTRSGRKAEKLSIEVWGGCDRVVIEDNAVDHWLSIGGCALVAARRNTIREKTGDVGFIGLEMIGQDLVVTDNLVDGGQQIGISVSNDAHNERHYCAYNTVKDMVQWGAQLQGDKVGARRLYYYKNKFLETQRGNPAAIYPGADGRGFRFNGNCREVTLDANEIAGNKAEGLELGGSGLDGISIIKNVIRGNAFAAVTGDPGSDLEWEGNTVSGNGQDRGLVTRGFANRRPAAGFTCPAEGTVGQAVEFTSTSSDPRGKAAHFLWDLGDGVPIAADHASHVYERPGAYRVTLVVWDDGGRGAIQERTITVRAADSPR